MKSYRDLRLIYAAAFLRSLGIGLMGVILGIYLARAGFSAKQIGWVAGVGLAGAAAGTLITSLRADRLGRRRTLVALALLAAVGGVGLMFTTQLPALLCFAFFGTLNSGGKDRGAAFALEQAVIPQNVSHERRTLVLSWYSMVLDVGHALGALGGASPLLFQRALRLDQLVAYRLTFGLYAVGFICSAACYLLLSPAIELERAAAGPPMRISLESRRIIARLAALSGLDSFGGGFLIDSLFAFWFFRRFGVSEATVAPLFFAAHLLNSGSYLVAAWLARRIGLVKTMVFTHIPSSLFLMAVPLAPSFWWAAGLFLARESLVEMDVPTRQSYIVAVVRPEERTFASGVTNLTRNVSWATAPALAGYLMQRVALGAPLFIGGGIKIAYDLLLYAAFRRLKPPEEQTNEAVVAVS